MIKSRADWPVFFNSLGLCGIGVEVGVLRAEFSEMLLQSWRGQKLYLVDSYRHHQGLIDFNNPDPNGHLNNMIEAFKRIYRFGERAVMIRDNSATAAGLFRDNSLDFVYIDAAHDYAGALSDLKTWTPKVRRGGIVCGDDYHNEVWQVVGRGPEAFTVIEVQKAVDDFARQSGYAIHSSEGAKPHQWWFFKN